MIAAFPERSMAVIRGWSKSDNPYVRRMASECMRISLPWAKKLTAAVERFEEYGEILTQLNNDSDPYVRRSVANNLNDLSKYSMEKFDLLVNYWVENNPTDRTLWIINHGSRTIRKRNRRKSILKNIKILTDETAAVLSFSPGNTIFFDMCVNTRIVCIYKLESP